MSEYMSARSEAVLLFAFVGFLIFAVAEMTYAFVANSLALLGDAAAMIVDALTYVMNLIAIRHTKRGSKSAMVLLGPFVSALALVGVMIYVLIDAIQELVGPGDGDVELFIVLFFGLGNLALDLLNLVLFWAFPDAYRAILTFTDPDVLEQDGGLNIRSALTHVMADTYRSVAVVLCAVLAMLFPISPSHSDAVGAIVVEIPVVVMCLQMCTAVVRRYKDQKDPRLDPLIRAEEPPRELGPSVLPPKIDRSSMDSANTSSSSGGRSSSPTVVGIV